MGPEAPGQSPEDNRDERSPAAAADRAGAGLDEDFRQLSEEAPSEGLMTIPERRNKVVRRLLEVMVHRFLPSCVNIVLC